MNAETDAPRILIADDDPLVREMLSALLSAHGAVVTPAVDGEAAVREAVLAPYDLCILDCDMPNMTGLEACPRIVASACTRNLPVLFLTGRNDDQTIMEAFSAGAADFLNKPVHPEILWRRVSNLLLLSQMKKARENLGELIKMSGTEGVPPKPPGDQDLLAN